MDYVAPTVASFEAGLRSEGGRSWNQSDGDFRKLLKPGKRRGSPNARRPEMVWHHRQANSVHFVGGSTIHINEDNVHPCDWQNDLKDVYESKADSGRLARSPPFDSKHSIDPESRPRARGEHPNSNFVLMKLDILRQVLRTRNQTTSLNQVVRRGRHLRA